MVYLPFMWTVYDFLFIVTYLSFCVSADPMERIIGAVNLHETFMKMCVSNTVFQGQRYAKKPLSNWRFKCRLNDILLIWCQNANKYFQSKRKYGTVLIFNLVSAERCRFRILVRSVNRYCSRLMREWDTRCQRPWYVLYLFQYFSFYLAKHVF